LSKTIEQNQQGGFEMKKKQMSPREKDEFVRCILKAMEDDYPFLGPLVEALSTGREGKVRYELNQLKRQVETGRPEKVKRLEQELQKLKNKLRKPPGPFRYLWLWIFGKKNGLKIYFPDLKKAG